MNNKQYISIDSMNVCIKQSTFDVVLFNNNSDFLGNNLSSFYYGNKADLKIFKDTMLVKRGKKCDLSI